MYFGIIKLIDKLFASKLFKFMIFWSVHFFHRFVSISNMITFCCEAERSIRMLFLFFLFVSGAQYQ